MSQKIHIAKRKRYKRINVPVPEPKLFQCSLENMLVGILANHAGERGYSEGAVEVLERIIRERDKAFTVLALGQLESRPSHNFMTPAPLP
jgi:hypothetical protein